jgi:hypothetical protein
VSLTPLRSSMISSIRALADLFPRMALFIQGHACLRRPSANRSTGNNRNTERQQHRQQPTSAMPGHAAFQQCSPTVKQVQSNSEASAVQQ